MRMAYHTPEMERCRRAETTGDCPRSHGWINDQDRGSSSVARASKDMLLAKHLIYLEREYHKLEAEYKTKSHAVAKARWDEARVIASLLGYGVTEHHVWEQVKQAIQKQGTAEGVWRGRMGAAIDGDWWMGAAANLVEIWNS